MDKTIAKPRLSRFGIGLTLFVIVISSELTYTLQIYHITKVANKMFFPVSYPIVGGYGIIDWLLFGAPLCFTFGVLLGLLFTPHHKIVLTVIAVLMLVFYLFASFVFFKSDSIIRLFADTYLLSMCFGSVMASAFLKVQASQDKSFIEKSE